ncbi:MAG TPA: DNA repair protein RadA [Hellea balneolensis]|uniref:DNA repair protein RadA n=1 Tax=Hellea balneolensis TaxID=287478 RepID=A0A7C5LUC4_9PROT|nr:DNA repair protein RadA [Hellea balneolensis]
MGKPINIFVCQSCGTIHGKWAGRCDSCGEWNSLIEEVTAHGQNKRARSKKGRGIEFVELNGKTDSLPRIDTGIKELNRVTGGGLVPGCALLVGGDPGIGKSTLMLQAAGKMAASGVKTAYISGEESIDQVRRRAERLGVMQMPVHLAAETSLGPILDGLMDISPDVVIIDSIQTLWSDTLTAAPGTVAQVRACAQELTRFAKKRGVCVILVGHVTKDGQIAGPRVVEHMVDAVLYFEGDRAGHFRLLRAHKNRFGPTDEIGVFEMATSGLIEVENPSALFLDDRQGHATGTAVFAGLEGTRPVLTEIQALVAQSAFGTPRRAVVGWDSGRLAMVIAVLEARCGINFAGKDVYLNVAGGLKINDPAADLAVASALISSMLDIPLPSDCVVFGEISLSGDVRNATRTDARLKEAEKLGFQQVISAPIKQQKGKISPSPLPNLAIKTLPELASRIEALQE